MRYSKFHTIWNRTPSSDERLNINCTYDHLCLNKKIFILIDILHLEYFKVFNEPGEHSQR
jgi:hypothetical protein